MSNSISGLKFGRLTAISLVRKTSKGQFWLCKCECGGEKVARDDTLKSGNTSSCGCYRRERITAANSIDITGQRFGKLVAIERSGYSKRHSVVWLCRCDCGGHKHCVVGKLRSGGLISCGCTVRTKGEPLTSERFRNSAIAQQHKRRAIKLASGGSFTAAQIENLWNLQRGRCACCHKKLGSKFHRDHKEPISRGGSNDISNIELLCAKCNLSKQDMDPIEWANKRGMLC